MKYTKGHETRNSTEAELQANYRRAERDRLLLYRECQRGCIDEAGGTTRGHAAQIISKSRLAPVERSHRFLNYLCLFNRVRQTSKQIRNCTNRLPDPDSSLTGARIDDGIRLKWFAIFESVCDKNMMGGVFYIFRGTQANTLKHDSTVRPIQLRLTHVVTS
jgi:hypothetical protein